MKQNYSTYMENFLLQQSMKSAIQPDETCQDCGVHMDIEGDYCSTCVVEMEKKYENYSKETK